MGALLDAVKENNLEKVKSALEGGWFSSAPTEEEKRKALILASKQHYSNANPYKINFQIGKLLINVTKTSDHKDAFVSAIINGKCYNYELIIHLYLQLSNTILVAEHSNGNKLFHELLKRNIGYSLIQYFIREYVRIDPDKQNLNKAFAVFMFHQNLLRVKYPTETESDIYIEDEPFNTVLGTIKLFIDLGADFYQKREDGTQSILEVILKTDMSLLKEIVKKYKIDVNRQFGSTLFKLMRDCPPIKFFELMETFEMRDDVLNENGDNLFIHEIRFWRPDDHVVRFLIEKRGFSVKNNRYIDGLTIFDYVRKKCAEVKGKSFLDDLDIFNGFYVEEVGKHPRYVYRPPLLIYLESIEKNLLAEEKRQNDERERQAKAAEEAKQAKAREEQRRLAQLRAQEEARIEAQRQAKLEEEREKQRKEKLAQEQAKREADRKRQLEEEKRQALLRQQKEEKRQAEEQKRRLDEQRKLQAELAKKREEERRIAEERAAKEQEEREEKEYKQLFKEFMKQQKESSANNNSSASHHHGAVNNLAQDFSGLSTNNHITSSNEINFNQLKIIKRIGGGAYGDVYLAKFSGIDVAVKIFKANSSDIPPESFKNDIAILTNLKSPNVVTLYKICSNPYCLVMEYAVNGSLRDVLVKYDLPPVTRLNFAYQITNALLYLHSHRPMILHHDIKSMNFLVDANWNVKITDFGLSQIKNPSSSYQSSTANMNGTISWMAPEIVSNPRANYTAECDRYSLGVVFWEIASGNLPYENMALPMIVVSIIQGMHDPIPQNCPQEFTNLITGLWNMNSQQRPQLNTVAATLERLCTQNNNQSQTQAAYMSPT
ncbi:MAG: protein kinase [Gammaproteobacteria bacterium]